MANTKAACLGLLLVLFSCFLPISAVHAAGIDLVQGIVGSLVTVSGLPTSQTYVVQWDGANYGSGTTPTTGIITFPVPETTGGTHAVIVQCPQGTQVLSSSFTVIPSITISPESGTVGTAVSVTGKGFAAAESTIVVTYDATNIKTEIAAGSNGSWSTSFTVPSSARGSHTVDASGASTTAASVGDKTFTVKPLISINPLNGGVGTSVTVSGSGFAASEAGINITYDTKSAKSGIVADSNGAWSTTFIVPKSSSGGHIVDAYGASTVATDVADITFAVASGISIDKSSASVGDTITVTGSGFGQNESGIFVTFDGIDKGSSTTADDGGGWTVSLVVPAAVNGTHTINARGTATAVASIANKTIAILAKIALNPAGGNVGDTINITGSGFGGAKNVTVTYGGTSVLSGISTDATGSFSGSFKVPAGKGGEIKVVATDADTISASAAFATETTPPPLPKIVSPGKGSVVGFIGDTKVNFKWTQVTDPSGVSYDLQVASDSKFSDVIINQTKLTTTEYKSTDDEALAHGEYYWRVRAVDGAGNASEWTAPSQMKAGFMAVSTFIIVVVVGLLVIVGIVLRARAVFGRR